MKLIEDFQIMRDQAELRALSNLSLERPLTEGEFKRMKALFNLFYGVEL